MLTCLIEHYYIPPVIFNVWKEEDEETGELRDVRICVDGKQRLTSVKAFMDGMIPCKDRNDVAWLVSHFSPLFFSLAELSGFEGITRRLREWFATADISARMSGVPFGSGSFCVMSSRILHGTRRRTCSRAYKWECN